MPKGYHHMTHDIQSQIYALKSIGTSLRKIATVVKLHVSTISREIKRNTVAVKATAINKPMQKQ